MLSLFGHHYSSITPTITANSEFPLKNHYKPLHAITRALQQIFDFSSKTITGHYTKLSKITALRAAITVAITATITEHYTNHYSKFRIPPQKHYTHHYNHYTSITADF
ncbi:MAG: hypothetical protein WC082_06260 [Victivallales bacterium]